MPFISQAQRRLFYAKSQRGEIAPATVKRWEKHTPKGKQLPKKVAADKEEATVESEKSVMQKAADLLKLDAKGISPPALISIMQGQLHTALQHPGMVALVSRRRERLRRLKDEIQNPGMHLKPEKPPAGAAEPATMGQPGLSPVAPGSPVPPSNHLGMFPGADAGVGAGAGAAPGMPAGGMPAGGMNVAASNILRNFAKRAVGGPSKPPAGRVAKVHAFKVGFFRKVAECGMLPTQFEAAMIKHASSDETSGWFGRKVKTVAKLGLAPMYVIPLLAFASGMGLRHLTRPEYSKPEELRTIERVSLYRRLGREARLRASKLQQKRTAKLVARGEKPRETDVKVPELKRTA